MPVYISAVSFVMRMEPKGWLILVNKHLYPSILNFPHVQQAWLADRLPLGYFGGRAPLIPLV